MPGSSGRSGGECPTDAGSAATQGKPSVAGEFGATLLAEPRANRANDEISARRPPLVGV